MGTVRRRRRVRSSLQPDRRHPLRGDRSARPLRLRLASWPKALSFPRPSSMNLSSAARSGRTRGRDCSATRPPSRAWSSWRLIALACIFGPLVTGHPFDRVYPDYVKVAGEPVRLPAGPTRSCRRSSGSRPACAPRSRTSTIGERSRPHRRSTSRAPDRRAASRLFRALRPVRPGPGRRARRGRPAARRERAARSASISCSAPTPMAATSSPAP